MTVYKSHASGLRPFACWIQEGTVCLHKALARLLRFLKPWGPAGHGWGHGWGQQDTMHDRTVLRWWSGSLCTDTYLDDLRSNLLSDLSLNAIPALPLFSQASEAFIFSYLLQSVPQYIPALLLQCSSASPIFWYTALLFLTSMAGDVFSCLKLLAPTYVISI